MTDGRPEWMHVCDLAAIHRDRNSEIRLRLVEGRKGFAVELRKWERSHHHDGLNAGGTGLMVPAERVAEVIAALQKGSNAASALRQAARA
jgi:hypothetical protein